jgi:sugar phosphate isomerase/epimerase
MQFGMPTLIENTSLLENARLCCELDLDFIELNMNMPDFQVEQIAFRRQEFLEIANSYDIYYTIHIDENFNVCDFNSLVSKAYMDSMLSTIELAKELNVPILNMHMNQGVYFTLPDVRVYLFERYKEIYIQRITEFRDICEEAIGDSNISICIENTDGFLHYQKEALDILMESKVFSLTWDIGHSHSVNDIDEAYISKHEDKLKHFHIHDALGRKNHLTLGTGEINLTERIKVAKACDCRCVIETKTIKALKESVAWIRNNLGNTLRKEKEGLECLHENRCRTHT